MRWSRVLLILGCLVFTLTASYAQDPKHVRGKEYTDLPDINAAGVPTPTQNLHWDGNGNVSDSFLYIPGTSFDVDAMAHPGDYLFPEVIANKAYLLFSVSGSGSIIWESPQGHFGTWATPVMINKNNPPKDVDALEVWGPELGDDALRFSLHGDPGGIAVFGHPGAVPIIPTSALKAALGLSSLDPDPDLDGLMMFGDQVLFSIAPLATPALFYDGGEIWVWNITTGSIGFLFHGGHLWDTAFPVAAHFGLPSENVNALEAVVPEPGAMTLLGAGILGLLACFWRRRK